MGGRVQFVTLLLVALAAGCGARALLGGFGTEGDGGVEAAPTPLDGASDRARDGTSLPADAGPEAGNCDAGPDDTGPWTGIGSLVGVWGSSHSSVWVVGEDVGVLHWDGVDWRLAHAPIVGAIHIWGGGANDVWVVGTDEVWTDSWYVVRWDGVGWATSLRTAWWPLHSIWGASTGQILAAGHSGVFDGQPDSFMAWTGSQWGGVLAPGHDEDYVDIAGTSWEDMWVLAWSADREYSPDAEVRIYRKAAATEWGWQLSYSAPATEVLLGTVWAVAPDDVWAAGAGCSPDQQCGATLHWDGTAWSTIPNNVATWLWGTWGSATDNVWAVGASGTIVHWDGTAWSPVPSGVTADLVAVWGLGRDAAWAVGADGTILRWDGVAWANAR